MGLSLGFLMIFAGVQSGSRETRPSGIGSKRRDEMGVSRAIQRKVVEGRKKKELFKSGA